MHLDSQIQSRRWMLVTLFVAASIVGTAHAAITERRLFNHDPQTNGFFGYSAGVSGNTMVIGAFLQDGLTPKSGAAYIFQKSGNQWVEQVKLVADDGQPDDWFGSSAAISGDTVVVGAPNATTVDGIVAGAAYVFRRVGNTWIQEAKLVPNDPSEFDDFGFDQGVSISGDTIVVGADRAVTLGVGQLGFTLGAAYVFTRNGSTWTQSARLIHPEGDFASDFGGSVSISNSTIVVGADFSTADGIAAAGAAYVYRLQNGQWLNEAKLVASDPRAISFFGASTAISNNTIAIGAFAGLNETGVRSGSAYVFERKAGAWQQTAKLGPADGLSDDLFGVRMAAGDDWVAVGAEEHPNPAGAFTGATYVYHREKNTWAQRFELFPSDGTDGAEFGCSLATDGKTLLVGAGHQDRPQGLLVGESYAYKLDD